ncbi:hypothetical protein RRG08_013165 [Elysia crispata]|uniref:PiggyBac transposable element-derived protein domain-containing protein n=1 Tax=Elysia crispata TaxID=231223 RepID=A0AAE1A250_9GAST|nr:hypothetical protein RRG08_013165 [Elysia crispata]
MSQADRCTNEGPVQKDIPQPVLFYNSNMAGVDLMDQVRSYYPVGRKSHKWWRSSFWFLFDVALVNAYTLYKNMPRSQGDKPISHFAFHLGSSQGFMQRRGQAKSSTRRRSCCSWHRSSQPDFAQLLKTARPQKAVLHLPIEGRQN